MQLAMELGEPFSPRILPAAAAMVAPATPIHGPGTPSPSRSECEHEQEDEEQREEEAEEAKSPTKSPTEVADVDRHGAGGSARHGHDCRGSCLARLVRHRGDDPEDHQAGEETDDPAKRSSEHCISLCMLCG